MSMNITNFNENYFSGTITASLIEKPTKEA